MSTMVRPQVPSFLRILLLWMFSVFILNAVPRRTYSNHFHVVTAFVTVTSPVATAAQAATVGSSSATPPTILQLRRYPIEVGTWIDGRKLHSNLHQSIRSRSLSKAMMIRTILTPRGGGGGVIEAAATTLAGCRTSPASFFNLTLFLLACLTMTAKILQRTVFVTPSVTRSDSVHTNEAKPAAIKSLQRRFLAVFWLLRCSDWLQGPYFYDVYTSKVFNGVSASMSLVSRLFLTGFASTAIFGPAVGRAADSYGRKKATLIFTVLYGLGALSTKSLALKVLLLGRVLSGIGTSLLFSAPESWLVAEAQNSGEDPDGKYLSETFSWAYAGDSIVAITAGQMATSAASHSGPTGPFELSAVFLALGGLLASVLWGENKAVLKSTQTTSIREAIGVVRKDSKIMLVGAVQSLFEAAMYIFVLQWPPAMAGAIKSYFNSAGAIPPYGTIFSCFMACCLLGSTTFGQLAKMAIPTEYFTVAMLSVATIAMSLATWTINQSITSLPILMGSFFLFEACVGMYFPSIGTLRSRYVPDSHRSVIMNLFGIPLNVLVVSVFLSIHKLGKVGALSISSGALGLATVCMFNLNRMVQSKNEVNLAV
jgi:MFS transporter, MFS domain-containing protein family, molybdate-anion transporter